jgi:hypothetical protein
MHKIPYHVDDPNFPEIVVYNENLIGTPYYADMERMTM